jgi:hypothetical protein
MADCGPSNAEVDRKRGSRWITSALPPRTIHELAWLGGYKRLSGLISARMRSMRLLLSQLAAAEERNGKSWPTIPAILWAASSGVKVPTSLPLPSAATTGMMSMSL